MLDVWGETVESRSRESALHSILLGVCSMESFSDFFCNSLHLLCWYVFDVLRVHEFSMTISWKPRDHMDVRMWHAHSSNISDHPLCVHGLLESLRDHPNGFEVPSSFRTIRDPTMMLPRAKCRSVTGSPVEGFSGYPLDARTTTTEADLEVSGNGGLSELAAIALRCANSPLLTSGIIP